MVFNLIPTEPFEYQVYADWLEDKGFLLTKAVRNGILPLNVEGGRGYEMKFRTFLAPRGGGYWREVSDGFAVISDGSGFSNSPYGEGFCCERWMDAGFGGGRFWED